MAERDRDKDRDRKKQRMRDSDTDREGERPPHIKFNDRKQKKSSEMNELIHESLLVNGYIVLKSWDLKRNTNCISFEQTKLFIQLKGGNIKKTRYD